MLYAYVHKQWNELPQVCDPFFGALAVCAVVVRPWHIAAGTGAES
jgi:hypothetical protein